MSNLITARNRAAYKPAVWSQRRVITTRTLTDYAQDLATGPAMNGQCFELIAQAEWPDACPATVQFLGETFPDDEAPSELYRSMFHAPAWILTSDVAANFADLTCAGVVVKWWSEGVSYFVVCDFGTGSFDIPVCDRVEVWAGAGTPDETGPFRLGVRASIGFSSSPAMRANRCSTPLIQFDPSAQETPGLFSFIFVPPWAREYDYLIWLPTPTLVQSAVIELTDLGTPILLPRQTIAIGGEQSTLNVTPIPVCPLGTLLVRVDPAATEAYARFSWLVRV